MLTLTNGKGLASIGPAASPSHSTDSSDLSAGLFDPTPDGDRLQALRLSLARHGVSVATTDGAGLILSGLGLAPDMRAAWLLARALNGRLK